MSNNHPNPSFSTSRFLHNNNNPKTNPPSQLSPVKSTLKLFELKTWQFFRLILQSIGVIVTSVAALFFLFFLYDATTYAGDDENSENGSAGKQSQSLTLHSTHNAEALKPSYF